VLERVALHQTRLRVPGMGLDARGVALGSRGLVLLPSLDRLVAFFAVSTAEQGLDRLSESLRIDVVRSKLGTREVALSFASESSDRMDHIADVARVTGGFTFTGSSRHFVNYRDASAPFGYDALEILPTDAALVLYHATFTQSYEVERSIDFRGLLLRLAPRPDPSVEPTDDEFWVLAEPGVGPSLLGYFARSEVTARVGIVEWPSPSRLEQTPLRQFLFRVESMPRRMRSLLGATPGITSFAIVADGVAVQHGYRHPVHLRACPVFDPQGLVLFRGKGRPPREIRRLPALAEVGALGRTTLLPLEAGSAASAEGSAEPPALSVPMRLVASDGGLKAVHATLVPPEELGLLRRFAYILGPELVATTRIALTARGAFVLRDAGLEALPIGQLFCRMHPSLFVPTGFDVAPAVPPEAVFRAFGSPGDQRIFLQRDAPAIAIRADAFVSLDRALLEPERWAPLDASSFDAALETPSPSVWFTPLGVRPLSDAVPEK
jgi:FtsH ternary system domain X7